MSKKTKIDIPFHQIADFCRRHHIRELSLFGSVLRDDFGPDSDVDVLVEFEPDVRLGFLKFFEIQDELEAIIGRKIDMVTPEGLKPLIRNDILSDAEVAYAA